LSGLTMLYFRSKKRLAHVDLPEPGTPARMRRLVIDRRGRRVGDSDVMIEIGLAENDV
jgi:hypothetical protein